MVLIIDLVDNLIIEAYKHHASDIHIAPLLHGVRVRLRIDGVLKEVALLPKDVQGEVISRIKVLSSLRIDEHQMAQDGRFRFTLQGQEGFVDVRVSIVPTYHGEHAVLRLLFGGGNEFTLDTLGFGKTDQQKIRSVLGRPSGMILATGPTGSGKTTTLYTLLRMLNSPEVSIITIEDPIEYAVTNIEQIQVNARSGITFANGLRSILRQDPNIIMVGEIRDAETAGIAVNTALTGHLLLSTLHTNDAATTLPRLLDMGVDTYLVASTVSLVIGQRLVRTLCDHCKESFVLDTAALQTLSSLHLKEPLRTGEILYRGKGCAKCGHTGYAGRVSIVEVLVAEPSIRDAILRKAPAHELRSIAIQNGMTTMLEDGFLKIRNGETTIEEVLRVIHE